MALPSASLATWGASAYWPAGYRVLTRPSAPLREIRRAFTRRFVPREVNCDKTATALPWAPLAIADKPASCPRRESVFTRPGAPAAEIRRAFTRQFAPSNWDQAATT